jgi:hypothetical protein
LSRPGTATSALLARFLPITLTHQTLAIQTHINLFTTKLATEQSWLFRQVFSINLELLTESQSTEIISTLWSAGEFIYLYTSLHMQYQANTLLSQG